MTSFYKVNLKGKEQVSVLSNLHKFRILLFKKPCIEKTLIYSCLLKISSAKNNWNRQFTDCSLFPVENIIYYIDNLVKADYWHNFKYFSWKNEGHSMSTAHPVWNKILSCIWYLWVRNSMIKCLTALGWMLGNFRQEIQFEDHIINLKSSIEYKILN